MSGADRQPQRVLRRFGAAAAAADRRRPDRAAATCSAVSRRRRTRRSAPRTASSATSRSTSPARPARAEKVVQLPGYPTPLNLTQSWWCGYGPYDDPTIVVCAVIENGGHGGEAAAPAALKVFEQYFHTNAPRRRRTPPTDGDRSSRLGSTRASRLGATRPTIGRRRLIRRLDWLLLAALAALVALRPLGDRRHHAARPRRLRRCTRQALYALARRRSSSSARCSSTRRSTAASTGRSTSARSG